MIGEMGKKDAVMRICFSSADACSSLLFHSVFVSNEFKSFGLP